MKIVHTEKLKSFSYFEHEICSVTRSCCYSSYFYNRHVHLAFTAKL